MIVPPKYLSDEMLKKIIDGKKVSNLEIILDALIEQHLRQTVATRLSILIGSSIISISILLGFAILGRLAR